MTLSTAEFQRIFFGNKATQDVDHLQRMKDIWSDQDPDRKVVAFVAGKRLEGTAARSAVRNAAQHLPSASTSDGPINFRGSWHRWYGDHRAAALKAMVKAGGLP